MEVQRCAATVTGRRTMIGSQDACLNVFTLLEPRRKNMMSSFACMREELLGIMYHPGLKARVFCCPSTVAQIMALIDDATT